MNKYSIVQSDEEFYQQNDFPQKMEELHTEKCFGCVSLEHGIKFLAVLAPFYGIFMIIYTIVFMESHVDGSLNAVTELCCVVIILI